MTGQPTLSNVILTYLPQKHGFFIWPYKGKPMFFISPDHKAVAMSGRYGTLRGWLVG